MAQSDRPAPLAPTRAGPVAALAAAIALLLGLGVAGEHTPGPPDQSIMHLVAESTGNQEALLRLLVLPTEPFVLLPLIALIALAMSVGGRRHAVALALLGPAVAVSMNTWILKPVFARYYDDHLAYPSGHTASLVAVLTTLALLARPGIATDLVTGISVLLVFGAGVGMIGLGYHYATDVVGAAAFAVAAVLTVAFALDLVSTRAGPSRSAR